VTWRAGVAVGACAGAAFAARLVDGFFIGAFAFTGLVIVAKQWWRVVVPGLVVAAALSGTVLLANAAILGSPLTTPYSKHLAVGAGSDQSLSAYDAGQIPKDFMEVFVTGEYRGRREPADPIGRQTLLLLGVPVGVALVLRSGHGVRSAFILASVASAAATLFYLSFRAGNGSGLKYGNAHYFKAWFPLWTIMTLFGAVAARDRLLLGTRRNPVMDATVGSLDETGKGAPDMGRHLLRSPVALAPNGLGSVPPGASLADSEGTTNA
jgi:hypothetical protein